MIGKNKTLRRNMYICLFHKPYWVTTNHDGRKTWVAKLIDFEKIACIFQKLNTYNQRRQFKFFEGNSMLFVDFKIKCNFIFFKEIRKNEKNLKKKRLTFWSYCNPNYQPWCHNISICWIMNTVKNIDTKQSNKRNNQNLKSKRQDYNTE